MRNSTFKNPGKGLKRSGFKPRPGSISRGSWKSSPSAKTVQHRSEMTRRVRKATVAEGAKYLAACRGEPCYLRVPGFCRLNPIDETIVPCHSNQSRHGKAGNLKADNRYTVPGCMFCHAWIDQNRVGTPRQVKFDVWDRAYEKWEPVRARKMGIQLENAA